MISLRFVRSSLGHWAEALWTQNDPPLFISQIFLIEASALALWTQALGDGFRPQALARAICSVCYLWPDNGTISSLASIIGVIIIWNWSHYRRRGFSFFHRAACSCHVVLQLWSGRLQHCHIDCTGVSTLPPVNGTKV